MKDIKIVATGFYYTYPSWLIEDDTIQCVKLTGTCTSQEVDALLCGIAGYNDICLTDNPTSSLMSIIKELKKGEVIFSGGLLFQEADYIIMPSCCCGLETWNNIINDIKAKRKPWLGHDPLGTCIYENGRTIVCSDDISRHRPKGKNERKYPITKIVFTDEELEGLFWQVKLDMKEFISGPLKSRIVELAPELAEEFCLAWSINFNDATKI